MSSQITKNLKIDINEENNVFKDAVDPKYFKEKYIKCKKALANVGDINEGDMVRPVYHN